MKDPRLSQRKMQILKAVVDAHIVNGEPVGSKYLSQSAQITCSPATIRNEMAELEEMGYLEQPHASAGRVPSELGYRFYVDTLARQYSATKDEIAEINERLRFKLTEMDEILSEASKLAASFTNYTGIAFHAGTGKVRVEKYDSMLITPKSFLLVVMISDKLVKTKTVQLPFSVTAEELKRLTDLLNLFLVNLTSDEITMPLIVRIEQIMGEYGGMVHPAIKAIYETMNEIDTADIRVEGVTKLLQYPEYSDVSKVRDLFSMIEEKDKLLDVISQHTVTEDGINICIGAENESDVMSDTTVIFKQVDVGGSRFAVGVIGPKRMDYQKVIGMITQLAGGLTRMYGGKDSAALPEGNTDGKDAPDKTDGR